MSSFPPRPRFNLPARLLAAFGLFILLFVPAVACGLDSDDDGATATLPAASPTSRPEVTPTPQATATPQTEAPTPSPTPQATPEPTPEPEPEAPLPGEDLLQLQADLQRAVDQYWMSGNYAYAVTDLQTGEMVSVYGDVPRLAGCVINLFVLYQAALDVDAGRYPLERIDALARATTWSSNAATAWQLYGIAGDGDATEGTGRVAALIEKLGMGNVLLDHPPGYHANSLGIDYNNWATAEDMNRALAALWSGELINGPMRLYLLEVLSDVKLGLNYLTAAVPEGLVSHKNGFFYGDTGWVDNDVGIVQLQRGDVTYAYAVSFFSEEVPVEYGDIVLGQQLGSLTYDVMLARYPLQEAEPLATGGGR